MAVLESMKMVSTVPAPFSGRVLSVDVVANVQVERGAPLLHLAQHRSEPDAPAPTAPLDLGVVAAPGVSLGLAEVFAKATRYLLGYDLDPVEARALAASQQDLEESVPPGDPDLLAHEDAFLDLFAELGVLYRPRTETEPGYALLETGQSTQEYFLSFLQWLDAERAGLPDRYRTRLERALKRYGVVGLERSEALEHAMLWMFRSFSRVPEAAPYVAAILQRRLAHVDQLALVADQAARQRLERLAAAAEGRQQLVADLARDVIFHCFDEPVLSAVTAGVAAEMREHLAALRIDPHRADRADRMDRLVWCPQPLRGMLLGAWREAPDGGQGPGADEGFRFAVLEVYARRFYRIRELHGLDHTTRRHRQLVFANYERAGLSAHLVVGYGPLSDLPDLAAAVAEHLAGVDPTREPIVDLVTWCEGSCPPIAEMSERVQELLAGCDFGRRLHRLDLTITSLAGDRPERDRTQHLTFRQDEDGDFTEQPLYRNLHPMLGKRLDLWRLSNFTLERLPSPEDVYLFHGVAKENPRDHRLFALAEVRDLVKVTDEESGRTSYPRLGRIGLEALAAMRAALARFPVRERPTANRLVLSVRPDLGRARGGVDRPGHVLRGPGPGGRDGEAGPARAHRRDRRAGPSRAAGQGGLPRGDRQGTAEHPAG